MRHHSLKLLFAYLLSCSLVAATNAAEPGDWDDPSWQLLREAHIHRDAVSLAAYLRDQCGADGDLRRVDALIRQLGSADFQEREQASKSLVAVGPAALAALRAVRNDPDVEVAHRVKECLTRIGDRRPELTLAAVRVLIRRGGAEAVPTLLRFLPFADFEELQDDLWFGLDALTVRQGKLDPALTEALRDPMGVRRAVAACIVGRRGDADQRGAVRKLLIDAEPEVRLRAAQGLLTAKDASCVPALAALLEGTPMETAWQAEELLRYIAGEEAPHATLGAGAADDRRACRAAWEAWWKERGPKVDLAKLDGTNCRPGLMLLCDGGLPEEATGRVWLLGCDGVPRWQLRKLSYPVDARLMAGGRVLVAERSLEPRVQIPLALPPRKRSPEEGVSMRELEGKVLWRYRGVSDPTLCQPLPNGNLFVAGQGLRMAEVSAGGSEVGLTTLSRPVFDTDSYEYPRRLLNSHILCRRYRELLKEYEWVDFDPSSPRTRPKLVFSTGLLSPISFLPGCGAMETLDPGCRTVAGWDNSFVLEFGEAGWPEQKCSIPGSFYAVKLRTGDIVVGGMGRVVELDGEYKLVWAATFEDQAYRVRPCLDLVRLGFDAPRYIVADAPGDWLRGLKSQNARVRRRSAEMVGEIGPVAADAIPALTALLKDPDGAVRAAAHDALGKVTSEATLEIRKALKDSDPKVRIDAIWKLGMKYERDAKVVAPAVMELLKDQDPKVRGQAANILGGMRLESRIVVPALIKAAHDNDLEVRTLAAHSLGRMGKEAIPAIPALLDDLKSKTPTLRGWSADALGEIAPRDERVFRALMEAIQGKEVNDNAAYVLSKCGPCAKEAVPILVKILESDDMQGRPEMIRAFRSIIVQALGQIGSDAKAAVPALIALIKKKDRNHSLQVNAIQALGRIGPAAKEAAEMLDEMQRDRSNVLV